MARLREIFMWFRGLQALDDSYGRKLPAPGLAVSNRLWASLPQRLTR
jgi:hypothetical protein